MENFVVAIERKTVFRNGAPVGMTAGRVRVTIDGRNIETRGEALLLMGEHARFLGDLDPQVLVPATPILP